MSICGRIREQRRKINVTQSELSETVGISLKTLQRWESGERTPNASILPKLAAALNTTTDYLLNGESPESRESLPINNAPMEVAPDYLDLGYWGNVAENANRAARSGDRKKIALITPLVKSAFEVLSEAELSDGQEKNSQSFIGIHGDNSEIRNNSVNVNTG